MVRIFFLGFILGCTLLACSNDKAVDSQAEQADATSSVAVPARQMSALEKQLEDVQAELGSRLEGLRAALDTTVVQERPELEGKIRKLEAREKQLTQHLKKFEQELSGSQEELEKRFNDLIADIKEDLKAVAPAE
jgi:chaperonin cofactor prefoldin